MSLEIFARQIAEVDERIADIHRRAPAERAQPSLLQEAFLELQSTLEELRVTEEEMRQQNEAMEQALESVTREKFRYLDLFESAPDGYLVTDTRGTILEANTAAQRLLGRSARFLVGKPVTVTVSEESRAAVQQHIGGMESAVGAREWEARLRHPQDGQFAASLIVTALRSRDGVGGLRWIIRDVSQRRQTEDDARAEVIEIERLLRYAVVEAEEARREQEEQAALLACLLAMTGAGIALLDPQGRCVRVSPQLALWSGLPPEALIGQQMASVLPQQWPSVQPFFARALAGETIPNAAWPGGAAVPPARTESAPTDLRADYAPAHADGHLIGVGIVVRQASPQ